MSIEFDGQHIEILRYRNKAQLEEIAPEVYERVKDSVFWENDPRMASTMAGFPGTVVRGDITFAHPKAAGMSSFERILEHLGDYGYWLIFDGNLEMERSIAITDTSKVVVLGDLVTVGLSNVCGQLYVEGTTRVSGTLYFDSNDGGFTRLTLSEPAGFIVTSANAFSINLRSKYFYDPLFRCGFDSAPTSPHEERIQAAFEGTPTVVTLEQLTAFYRRLNDKAADDVAAGNHESWIDEVVVLHDSRAFARYFDKPLDES